MARVTLVNQEIVRRGLRNLLQARPRLEIVWEAETATDALAQVRSVSPDIAIVGYSLQDLNGHDLTVKMRAIVPSLQVLLYTRHRNERLFLDLIRAGANGIVLKTNPAEDVLAALDSLSVRRRYFSNSVSEVLSLARRRGDTNLLSSRETQIVRLVGEGYVNPQIANLLGISLKTVEAHRANVMRKLNLSNTAEIVRFARRNGIIAA